MAFCFLENVIKEYLEELRDRHAEVEFDYTITLETNNGDQSVYTVSHGNKTKSMMIVWRYKIFSNGGVGLFCSIPGVFTSYWASKDCPKLSVINALDEIYGSKLMKEMR